ncbi:MAG: lipopolysaccharide biosynthesis protein [Tidjanibacter sp.]|nr:lipopolysaccharide biosynthesis protein [Tidjanibacter sp.]
MELKQRVVKGVAWSTVEKICSALLQLVVSLVLLSLLTPEDYGIVAIAAAFASILLPVVDSGFSQALIRKNVIDRADSSSVFFLNMAIAAVLYILLLAVTPAIADFYQAPVLRQIAPVLFLLIPINALSNIQNAILSHDIEFKRLSLITLCATVVSSVVAIVLALRGLGVWALVCQRIFMVATRTLLLWLSSKWRPAWIFSIERIRGMFRYGSRILLSDLLSNIYYQISSLSIGKFYTKTDLGYYDRGNKIKELPVNSTIMAVLGVTFPAFARLKDDNPKLADSARKVFQMWTFGMLPLMCGLIAVCGDFFRVLLPEVWLPTVPYLQILCLGGLFSPLSVLSYNIVKVKSDGKMVFRIELIKKAIATLILAITIPISVRAIAWGQVAIFLSDMLVNTIAAHRFVGEWRFWRLLTDAAPYAAITLLMIAGVMAVGLLSSLIPLWAVLTLKIVAGVGLYAALAELFGLSAWRELKEILRGYGRSRKQKGAKCL